MLTNVDRSILRGLDSLLERTSGHGFGRPEFFMGIAGMIVASAVVVALTDGLTTRSFSSLVLASVTGLSFVMPPSREVLYDAPTSAVSMERLDRIAFGERRRSRVWRLCLVGWTLYTFVDLFFVDGSLVPSVAGFSLGAICVLGIYLTATPFADSDPRRHAFRK